MHAIGEEGRGGARESGLGVYGGKCTKRISLRTLNTMYAFCYSTLCIVDPPPSSLIRSLQLAVRVYLMLTALRHTSYRTHPLSSDTHTSFTSIGALALVTPHITCSTCRPLYLHDQDTVASVTRRIREPVSCTTPLTADPWTHSFVPAVLHQLPCTYCPCNYLYGQSSASRDVGRVFLHTVPLSTMPTRPLWGRPTIHSLAAVRSATHPTVRRG